VQQALLADHRVEAAGAEGQHLRVAAHVPDQGTEPDQRGEARPRRAPRVGKVDAGHPGAEAVGQEARGAAEPGADIEHRHPGGDGGALRQRLDRGETAVVILVPPPEILRTERAEAGGAVAGGCEHLRLVDRVAIVEIDHVGSGLAHEPQCRGGLP
jgi:hypothetical protein